MCVITNVKLCKEGSPESVVLLLGHSTDGEILTWTASYTMDTLK